MAAAEDVVMVVVKVPAVEVGVTWLYGLFFRWRWLLLGRKGGCEGCTVGWLVSGGSGNG